MPVQYWPRPNHQAGLLDFFASIRGPLNKDGLYQYSIFKQADILTASGVGGGSLIYSNVTLRPQAEVLQGIGLNLGDASNLTDDDYLYLDRARALRDAAKLSSQKLGIQMPWAPLDLSLIEYDPDQGAQSQAAKNHTFCERQ